VPEQRTTTVIARSRSRERSRTRERRDSPPSTVAPIVINNRVYNDYSSDDDDRQLSHRRSRERSHSRSSFMTREDWEADQARRELEQLRLARAVDSDGRRIAREYRDEAELERAKAELEAIKRREARAEDEKRIRKDLELRRLREEEEEAQEKIRREKEAALAVERYRQQEFEKAEKERQFRERNEKEYRRRLQDDLLKSGLDEKAVAAILDNKKIPDQDKNASARPTYTRMARRYLSIETLRTFRVEYDVDNDPEYILIKRWVPEWEQDQFWKHTKVIREKRTSKTLLIEEKKHHRHEPEFEWVRKKERHRSKSPGLLMYLAGAKPA